MHMSNRQRCYTDLCYTNEALTTRQFACLLCIWCDCLWVGCHQDNGQLSMTNTHIVIHWHTCEQPVRSFKQAYLHACMRGCEYRNPGCFSYNQEQKHKKSSERKYTVLCTVEPTYMNEDLCSSYRAVRRSNCFHTHEAQLAAQQAAGSDEICQVSHHVSGCVCLYISLMQT